MTNIIENLFYGNIDPIAKSGCNNLDLRNMEANICRTLEKTENTVTGKEKNEILKIINDYNEYVNVVQKQSFCDGFSLRVRIAAEALLSANHLTLK